MELLIDVTSKHVNQFSLSFDLIIRGTAISGLGSILIACLERKALEQLFICTLKAYRKDSMEMHQYQIKTNGARLLVFNDH